MFSPLTQTTTDFSRLAAQRADSRAAGLLSQLASGQRGDAIGAANQAVAAQLGAQEASQRQASQNIVAGQSALAVADTGLASLGDISAQMRQLAVQSGNATLTPAGRGAIDVAYQQLSETFSSIANSTALNGTPLLTGAGVDPLQVGTGSGASSQLAPALPTIDGGQLGLAGSAVATQVGARRSLSAVDDVLDQLAAARGALGANQAQLGSAQSQAQSGAYQAAAALGRIVDTDYSASSGAYRMAAVQQQAAYTALGSVARALPAMLMVA